MPRPRWEPKTDEQRDAIAAVVQATAAATAADEALRDAVLAADRLQVPRSHLAEVTEIPPRTFYRRLAQWSEPTGAGE